MNQITGADINLEQMTKDIYEFYKRGRQSVNYDVIKDLIERWSYEKYPIFVKMGNRLRIESKEKAIPVLNVSEEFKEATSKLFQKHNKKSEEKQGSLDAVIANIHGNLRYLPSEDIEKILKNTAFEDVNDFSNFLRRINQYEGNGFGNYNFTNAMKQKKLTKQVTALYKENVVTPSAPRYFDPDEAIQYERKAKLHFSLFGEAFNIALSELKQNLTTEEDRTPITISIHPYDFVTMSFNINNWVSCFHPENCYAKSVFSVMTDDSTMLSFVPMTTEARIIEEVNSPVYSGNKKFRAMIHFDPSMRFILVNKVYPSNYRVYVNLVKDAVERANLVSVTPARITNAGENAEVSAVIYNDLNQIYNYDILGARPEEVSQESLDDTIWCVGRDVPCMTCGENHFNYDDDDCEDSAYYWDCMNCRRVDWEVCADCGDSIHPDDTNWEDNDCYCGHCADRRYKENAFENDWPVCTRCGDYIEPEFAKWIDDEPYCEWCAENKKDERR